MASADTRGFRFDSLSTMEPLLQQTVALHAEKILQDYCQRSGITPDIRYEKLLRRDFGSTSPSGLGPVFRAVVSFTHPVSGPLQVESVAPNKKLARRYAAATVLSTLLGHPLAPSSSELIFTPQVSPASPVPEVKKIKREKRTSIGGSQPSLGGAAGTEASTRTDSSTTASAGSEPSEVEEAGKEASCVVKDLEPSQEPTTALVSDDSIGASTEVSMSQTTVKCDSTGSKGKTRHRGHMKSISTLTEEHGSPVKQQQGKQKHRPEEPSPLPPHVPRGEFQSIHTNALSLAHMQHFNPHMSGEVVRTVYAHSEMQMRAAFNWAATFSNELRRLQQESCRAPEPAKPVHAQPASVSTAPLRSPTSLRVDTSFAPKSPCSVLRAGTPVLTPVAIGGINYGYTVSALPFDLPVPPGTFTSSNAPSMTCSPPPEPLQTEGEAFDAPGCSRLVRLRVATADDVGHIMRMIRELADFEREPHAVKTDERTLLRDGFGGNPAFHVMLAELPTSVTSQLRGDPLPVHSTPAEAHTPPQVTPTPQPAPQTKSKSWASVVRGSTEVSDASTPALGANSNSEELVTDSPLSTSSYTPLMDPTTEWEPVGMAFCFTSYSTWEGKTLFLEDLYVSPPFRRQGISKLLFTALARAALVAKCARMQWTVLNWNEPAIAAYAAPPIAATHLNDWEIYRLTSGDIKRLADATSVIV
jgi:hypothetical protein